MSRGHGKNKFRLAGEDLARSGQRDINELFKIGEFQIEVPAPCFCRSGVERMKLTVGNPNHDGAHWHASMWTEFERKVRESDARRGLKYTKERL